MSTSKWSGMADRVIRDPFERPVEVDLLTPSGEELRRAINRCLTPEAIASCAIPAIVNPASEPQNVLGAKVREGACGGCGCDVWVSPSLLGDPRLFVFLCADCLIASLTKGGA